ncbi:hypothetical protein, partial [Lysobacter capsici]|uniref:hypothetical protein n=1 Tax=Lysobacter capsici TaxID=435897 RepID=UPI00398D39A5
MVDFQDQAFEQVRFVALREAVFAVVVLAMDGMVWGDIAVARHESLEGARSNRRGTGLSARRPSESSGGADRRAAGRRRVGRRP